jgi:hypothetical protein
MLHLTNGQATLNGLKEGSIPGVHFAWEDPLHDGPVPDFPTLEALSERRARALSDFGWGSYEALRTQFSDRDRTLEGFRSHDETVLWFEHDLYDQLQLMQLLDWFSRQDLAGARLSLVQIGEYPGMRFYGLGQLSGEQLAALFPARVPVTARHLDIGRRAWKAVCAPDPTALTMMAHRSDPAMPFLAAALQRLLEEYPSATNGLSRTEQQLLVSGALGARHRQAFYLQSQEFEACPWGDASVFLRLDGLAAGPNPALDRLGEDEFAINEQGGRLLGAEEDWVGASGGIDRWIGGVHLTGSDAAWRWDEQRKVLAAGRREGA